MDFKSINPLWSLHDPLTVEQAAALIAGVDPMSVDPSGEFFRDRETGLTDSDGITWVHTAFAALTNAIDGGRLRAQLRYDAEPRYVAGIDNLMERGHWNREDVREIKNSDGDAYVISATPRWSLSLIARADLIAWLQGTPIRPEVFFPATTDAPDYLDPNDPRYASKLAAAVRAWQATTDTNGRTPKQALAKWLREHAAEFGMTDDEGKPNETAIEEASKLANWQPGGGAPKTPGE